MTLSVYDRKILNFIYELSKQERLYSTKEIAKRIMLEGGKQLSEKTVQRWFKFLRKPYPIKGSLTNSMFSYYPSVYFEKLGLSLAYVLYYDTNMKILESMPYQLFAGFAYNPSKNQECLIVGYAVPQKQKKELKKFVQRMVAEGHAEKAKLIPVKTAFTFMAPLHKVMDRNGRFDNELNSEDEIEKQIAKFKTFLIEVNRGDVWREIRKNPLIIPTIFEYQYEFWSSLKVWNAIKARLGSTVHDYIRKDAITDEAAVKKIRNALLQSEKAMLISQIRAVYTPLEAENNLWVYTLAKADSKEDMLAAVKRLALNSVVLRVHSAGSKGFFAAMLLNEKAVQELPQALKGVKVEYCYVLQYKKSVSIFTNRKYHKFSYEKLFEPKKAAWTKFSA